jgi:hypothetical protein
MAKAKGSDAKRAGRNALNRATSSRNAERNHLGTASDIKSEWRARSSRKPGRLPSESAASTVAVALARLKSLRIIHWVRRCEHHWRDGRFELRQLTNAYILLPPSQWLGLDPAPAEAPAPQAGTWGDHPPVPDLIEQAIAEHKHGGSVDSALGILEQDETDLLARSTARLFRAVLANENGDKRQICSGVRNSD